MQPPYGYPPPPPPKGISPAAMALLVMAGLCTTGVTGCIACTCLGASARNQDAPAYKAPKEAPKPTCKPNDAACRKRLADAAIRGNKPGRFAWDESCIVCEAYVKGKMNDPSSFDHISSTEAEVEGTYWVVVMRFRGKNALGALVVNSRKFYIRRGEVERME